MSITHPQQTAAPEKTFCAQCRVAPLGRKHKLICSHCVRANWRKRNRARMLELQRNWYAANRERTRELARKWYQANRDKMKVYQQRWCRKNPTYYTEYFVQRTKPTESALSIFLRRLNCTAHDLGSYIAELQRRNNKKVV